MSVFVNFEDTETETETDMNNEPFEVLNLSIEDIGILQTENIELKKRIDELAENQYSLQTKYKELKTKHKKLYKLAEDLTKDNQQSTSEQFINNLIKLINF
jgi:phage shock protein A